jgi:hypothetical protein
MKPTTVDVYDVRCRGLYLLGGVTVRIREDNFFTVDAWCWD